jgi:ubiquitin-protein ligase E3 B
VDFINLVTVMIRLLDSCGQYVTAKQSNMAHWHPVLGWFSSRLDKYLQESLGTVRSQLTKLWNPVCLRVFVAPLLEVVAKLPELPAPSAVPTFYY